MSIVWITALGVGGATVIGAILGFIFKNISHRFSDIILGFASGVMLAAAIAGLVLPAIELSGSVFVAVAGIMLGALCLSLMDRLIPHLHSLVSGDGENHPKASERIDKVILFVLAIAIHNFPEGIAAGVGFGTGNVGEALTIAGGIALQNIPEGMAIIAPMLSAGIGKRKTIIAALLTGIVEVVGTMFGYFAVSFSTGILPFALAFAGGTMLYVISDEMIPETHSHGNEKGATYALLIGFCVMMAMDFYIG